MPAFLGIALVLLLASGAAPGAEEQASLADVRWGLAPLRWRGLLSTDLRSFSAEGQPRRIQRVDNGQVQVSSYVWQPWFAQVQGGIGALSSSERGTNAAHGTTMTGNGMLNVFPASRFPFQANFDISDSRSSDQFTGQSYQSRRYGLRQSHRNLAGDQNSTASYSRSTLDATSFGRDRLDVLNGSHSRRLGAHALDGSGDFTRNLREGSDERAQFARLYGRHGWASDGLVSADTTASYGASDMRLASGGALAASRNEFFQLNNFFTWRQDEDEPLYVTGGGRYFHSQAESDSASTDADSLMGHANGNYRYSKNLFLNAGASATQARSSGGPSTLLTTQSAGASYSADPRRLGANVYNFNLAANFLNQTGGGDGSRRITTGQAAHNLQRSIEIGPAQALTATFGQSFTEARDSIAGALHTISHNGSLMWRATRGNALAGILGLSAADSRSRGHTNTTFQLVNAQASGQLQFDRYSSLLGNLTLQGTRQQTPSAPMGPFDVNINGGVTYQHQRAFGVRGLRYLAIYERNDYRLNTRLEGDLNATREHVNSSFEQRLEYRIGKLEARASFRLAEVDGKESALLFLRLARELGD